MSGIAAWGTYLPAWRLQRSAIGAVLGSGGGRGTRAVASYDEDTTTLAVEAGRRAARGRSGRGRRAGPVPLDTGPAVPGQDQRDHGARGVGAGPRERRLRLRGVVALGGGHAPGGLGRGRRRAHHFGRRLGPADRAGRLGRRARQRRRRRRVCVRPDRSGGRAGGPGRGERRVPRPVARAGRSRLARVGGALRRGALRATRARGRRGGAQGRRSFRRRRRPRCGDRPTRGGPSRPQRAGSACATACSHPTCWRRWGISARRTPRWRSATCSSAPRRARSCSCSRWPTAPTLWCCARRRRCPPRRRRGQRRACRASPTRWRRGATTLPTPRS